MDNFSIVTITRTTNYGHRLVLGGRFRLRHPSSLPNSSKEFVRNFSRSLNQPGVRLNRDQHRPVPIRKTGAPSGHAPTGGLLRTFRSASVHHTDIQSFFTFSSCAFVKNSPENNGAFVMRALPTAESKQETARLPASTDGLSGISQMLAGTFFRFCIA